MKVDLFTFQQIALESLRNQIAMAQYGFNATHTPQVISFTAPTGAGKTIIMSALIESVLCGTENHPEQPEAIILWLSDSPELNQQSKDKIATKADRIMLSQCVTIEDESFDREILEDGHVYFLNTQKLSKSSNLTHTSDNRQWTIWQTLQNTVKEKGNSLIVIIDEAHRGAKTNQVSIMQKFIVGSPTEKLSPMPIVIGMSATPERFNKLIGKSTSTIQQTVVRPEDVRKSGLLKDQIAIYYPEDNLTNKAMAVLQVAADEWKDKCEHWFNYSEKQHYKHVYPVFVIQVENGKGSRLTETDLDDCLRKIEQRTGHKFVDGEVVHTFGQTQTSLTVNGINVRYEEPSRIQDDRKIKIVFFKENLSTGWDCPRAETMMSFRRATDATYIAQLLGRMVRTPLQMHIEVDESLNSVHLYLPHFDAQTVEKVVNELQNAEGGDIPTEVIEQGVGGKTKVEIWSTTPKQYKPATLPVNTSKTHTAFNNNVVVSPKTEITVGVSDNATVIENKSFVHEPDTTNDGFVSSPDVDLGSFFTQQEQTAEYEDYNFQLEVEDPSLYAPKPNFDRNEVMTFINEAGIINYEVHKARVINDYAKSLFKLAHFLTQTSLYREAVSDIRKDIVGMIKRYIIEIKENGTYNNLRDKVLEFRLASQVFDVYGKSVDNYMQHELFATTNADLERQFRQAEARMYGEGLGALYGNDCYDPDDEDAYMIDFILFVANLDNLKAVSRYAERRFNDLNDEYRKRTIKLSDKQRYDYNRIVADSDLVTKHLFRLPQNINVDLDKDGESCSDHLFVNSYGWATFNLNEWEKTLLDKERGRGDFVCWLRNQPRKPWAICIPYEMGGVTNAMYPDFLVIRKEPGLGWQIDILEPHMEKLADNLPKAKGMAEFARENPGLGRVQLMHMKQNGTNKSFVRLDLTRTEVNKKVLAAISNDELMHLFDIYGITD